LKTTGLDKMQKHYI